MSLKIVHVLLLLIFTAGLGKENKAFAQNIAGDTLRITIKEAEGRFLKNNLSLLAAQYQIDHEKAEIITASLFNNPEIGFENILYNPDTRKFFDMSYDGGQYTGLISQLFQTAGKRNKNIQLAKIGARQAGYEFFDLLRTLKYTLRTNFNKIYFQQASLDVYEQQISSLSTTLAAFKKQYAAGNIAQHELLRIQSQLYALQTEKNELQEDIDAAQYEFKLLIRVDPKIRILPMVGVLQPVKEKLAQVPYKLLLDSAYNNRYDLKLAKGNVAYNDLNLRLQQAMAVPDITVSLTYDKYGSTVRDYTGLGINIPLPLFNRNQGAIKQAKIAIQSSKNNLERQQDEMESEIDQSFQAAFRLEKLEESFDPGFKNDFNHLIEEVTKNYQKRNLSLLEFLDFYDSYKTNVVQYNELQMNRMNSLEQLNFVTGTQFFNK